MVHLVWVIPKVLGPSVGCESALFTLQLLSVAVCRSLGSKIHLYLYKRPPTALAPASVNPGSIVNKTGDLLDAPANGANETSLTTYRVTLYVKQHIIMRNTVIYKHFQPDSNQDNACKDLARKYRCVTPYSYICKY